VTWQEYAEAPEFNYCTTYYEGDVVQYDGRLAIYYDNRFWLMPDGVSDHDEMMAIARRAHDRMLQMVAEKEFKPGIMQMFDAE